MAKYTHRKIYCLNHFYEVYFSFIFEREKESGERQERERETESQAENPDAGPDAVNCEIMT